jgi:alkanesulfonate monooxygenase SsuD/methylene tetrahydromethanopterin reductase-like flavin-dependent oxidoreductase (luciferase family)
VAWGDEATIAKRIREHLDGGADHVLLQPLGHLDEAFRQLESLAPAVRADVVEPAAPYRIPPN